MNRDALWKILDLRGVPPKLINLISELYSDTESAVRCGDAISDLCAVVTGVRQGCVLAPTLFSTCVDWFLGRMLETSSCGASFRNVKMSDLDFADDGVIFAEALDILLGALNVLNEESEPLGLRVSLVKTKIQAFNDIVDAAMLSVPVCGEDVESLRDSLTLAVIFMSLLAVSQRSIDIWFGPGESWIHGIMWCGAAGTCAGGRKSESSGTWCFQSCSTDVRLGL